MKNYSFGTKDATYKAVGQYQGIKELVDEFYFFMDTIEEAKIIRQQHSTDLSKTKDKLVLFLCGWMGGPKLYQEKYGAISIPGSHSHLMIGEDEKNAWLLCMEKAMIKCQYPNELRHYLLAQFNFPAQRIVQTSKASIKSVKS